MTETVPEPSDPALSVKLQARPDPGRYSTNDSILPVSPDSEPAEGKVLVGLVSRGFAGLAGHLDHFGNLQGAAYLEEWTGLRSCQCLFH